MPKSFNQLEREWENRKEREYQDEMELDEIIMEMQEQGIECDLDGDTDCKKCRLYKLNQGSCPLR